MFYIELNDDEWGMVDYAPMQFTVRRGGKCKWCGGKCKNC